MSTIKTNLIATEQQQLPTSFLALDTFMFSFDTMILGPKKSPEVMWINFEVLMYRAPKLLSVSMPRNSVQDFQKVAFMPPALSDRFAERCSVFVFEQSTVYTPLTPSPPDWVAEFLRTY